MKIWTDLPNDVFPLICSHLTKGQIKELRAVDRKANRICTASLLQRLELRTRMNFLIKCHGPFSTLHHLNIPPMLKNFNLTPFKFVISCRIAKILGLPISPALVGDVAIKQFDESFNNYIFNRPISAFNKSIFTILDDKETVKRVLRHMINQLVFQPEHRYFFSNTLFLAVEDLRDQNNTSVNDAIEESIAATKDYDLRDDDPLNLFLYSLSRVNRPCKVCLKQFLESHSEGKAGESKELIPLILAYENPSENPLPKLLDDLMFFPHEFDERMAAMNFYSPSQINQARNDILKAVTFYALFANSAWSDKIIFKFYPMADQKGKDQIFEIFIENAIRRKSGFILSSQKFLDLKELSPDILSKHFTNYLLQFSEDNFDVLTHQLLDYVKNCHQRLTSQQVVAFIAKVKEILLSRACSYVSHMPYATRSIASLLWCLQPSLTEKQKELHFKSTKGSESRDEIETFFPPVNSPLVNDHLSRLFKNFDEDSNCLFFEGVAPSLSGEHIKEHIIPRLHLNSSLLIWTIENLSNFNLTAVELNQLVAVLIYVPKDDFEWGSLCDMALDIDSLFLSEEDAFVMVDNLMSIPSLESKRAKFINLGLKFLPFTSLEEWIIQLETLDSDLSYKVIHYLIAPSVSRQFFVEILPHIQIDGKAASRLQAHLKMENYDFVVELLVQEKIVEEDLPKEIFALLKDEVRLHKALPFK